MKDGAGKQQILRYHTFLRPGFEKNVLGCLPGSREDKMRERKDCSQTVIHIRGLLKVRVQMPHLRVNSGHVQLSPGIRLQIELDAFMRNVQGIKTELRQDARPVSFDREPLVTCACGFRRRCMVFAI